jgi:hypothetical protein
MMPMAFCASLAPWLKAMKQADTSCSRLNSRVATLRVTRKQTQLINTINENPMANPKNGARTMASITGRSPDHFTVAHPPCVTAAPSSPPINAWDELVGNPSNSVKRFHKIAPANAAATISWVTKSELTIPAPTILATAVDMKAPATLRTPAAMTATSGLTTLVETTVAMELALSCQPFEKSKRSANTTTMSSIPVKSGMVLQAGIGHKTYGQKAGGHCS